MAYANLSRKQQYSAVKQRNLAQCQVTLLVFHSSSQNIAGILEEFNNF